VNRSGGGPRYIVDERTARTIGEVRDGKDALYRNPRGGTSCRGGTEYTIILGCVSLPTSVVLGVLGAVIVVTYGYIAITVIQAL